MDDRQYYEMYIESVTTKTDKIFPTYMLQGAQRENERIIGRRVGTIQFVQGVMAVFGGFGLLIGIIFLPLLAAWGMFKSGENIAKAQGCLPAGGWLLATVICFAAMMGSAILYIGILGPFLL